jgi:1,4-alpha-glucan branching enzyme
MAQPVTDDDRWLFAEGRHDRLYHILGCHLDGETATFRVWAPGAAWVSVVGDWNGWNESAHPMSDAGAGLWEATIGGVGPGLAYKYRIAARPGVLANYRVNKADPFALHAETPPATASRTWQIDYQWGDSEWMADRHRQLGLEAPVSIYELHLGSWRQHGYVTYRGIAEELASYLVDNGFTHVELLPVMEHPFYGSWGYQCTGFFAPTSRYGTPEDLMYLIDHLHQRGIGVVLDWVPSHFPTDEHGLGLFDGTHLYEHADPRRGFHPDWGSYIFNYERPEVQSFLLSSAHFWLDRYHVDGLRVDAVASMLYLDYSRPEGEWIPNRHGGRENLAAVDFLRKLTATTRRRFLGVGVIAEESTAWPKVSGPVEEGGLGFDYKWDMGWMNDTLRYIRLDPLFRCHPDNHRLLTFRGLYATTEKFVLSLSHDEVVHGKRSLLGKQYGEGWRRFAGLRALYGYMWGLPGKKLLFMGGEFGQWNEWNHDADLSWELLQAPAHQGILAWVRTLNLLLASEPALCRADHSSDGFRWVEPDDYQRATLSFLRQSHDGRPILVIVNFTPVVWNEYLVGVPLAGRWHTLASSDSKRFGGEGPDSYEPITASPVPNQGFPQTLRLTLAPLSAVFLAPEDWQPAGDGPARREAE